MEAKKQGLSEEDLSMEEILQSIRRIIADDGDDAPKAAAPAQANGGEKPVSASDILELTDMLEDDGTITNLKEANPPAQAVDVLDNIDAALAPEPVAVKEEKPEVKVEMKVEAAAPAPTPAPAELPNEVEAIPEDGSLLSKSAEDAAISALDKLKSTENKPAMIHSPVFRSGNTVEDMVEEMLRPMMKEWLDNNLPAIVERIVEREVTRLARR
jgi:cell pole-organizing protein PopZ